MSAANPSLQPLQDALRRITETLATELVNPGTATPSWSHSEWVLARAVAVLHGVCPLLANALRWESAPEAWTGFLADQRAHTAIRFMRMRQLMSQLDAELRKEGIPLVALKGAALHALGLYSPGERPMADLDLLGHQHDEERTARLLNRLGFRVKLVSARHLLFEPQQPHAPSELGEHSANDIKIELHARISEPLPVDHVDITDRVFPRAPHPGLNGYPSNTALMTHLLLHAAGALTFRSVRLLHLKDIALVAASMTTAAWKEMLAAESPDASARAWWAFPPLWLAARYFSCVPQWVLEEAESSCPRGLARAYRRRTLVDVSYSTPWIEALPAMAWAVSARMKLRYALQRLRPEPEVLAIRKVLHSEPRNARSEWARLSQFRRVLRLLTSRPERVETAAAVRAAFEQSR